MPIQTPEVEGVGQCLKVNTSLTIPVQYYGDSGMETRYMSLLSPVEHNIMTGETMPQEVDGYRVHGNISTTYSSWQECEQVPIITAPSSKQTMSLFQQNEPERYSYIFVEGAVRDLEIGEQYKITFSCYFESSYTVRYAVYEYDSSTYNLGARLAYDTSQSGYRVSRDLTFYATTPEIIIYAYTYYQYSESYARSFNISIGYSGKKLVTVDRTNQPMALVISCTNFYDEDKMLEINASPTTSVTHSGYWGNITIDENKVITELTKDEEKELPEYSYLTYIQSTGTQYIDTGIDANGGIIIECKCRFMSEVSTYNCIFGGRKATEQRLNLVFYKNTGRFWFGANADNETNLKCLIGTMYKIKFVATLNQGTGEGQGTRLFINNEEIGVSQSVVNGTNTGYHIYLFGDNKSGTFANGSAARVYSYRVTDISTGEVIQDLKPVKRNSDGVVGMYDSVTNTFLPNLGTGSFTAGSLIF